MRVAPTPGTLAPDSGTGGSISSDWVALPPRNNHADADHLKSTYFHAFADSNSFFPLFSHALWAVIHSFLLVLDVFSQNKRSLPRINAVSSVTCSGRRALNRSHHLTNAFIFATTQTAAGHGSAARSPALHSTITAVMIH